MCKRIFLLCVCIFIPVSAELFAVTGDEAVAKFRSRFYGLSTLRGAVSITSTTGEMMSGSFKFMAPGKFYIKFSAPAGKIIATNGKKLWVYDPNDNVCGVQDVGGGGSGGIAGIINGYMSIASSGGSDTTIRLKNPKKDFRDIIIQVDSSYLPKKITFRRENGDGMAVSFSNLTANDPMSPGLFDFNVPANVQLVKNPLNIR